MRDNPTYIKVKEQHFYCNHVGGVMVVNYQRDDDEVCFVLDQYAEVDFYSASPLKQQSVCRHVAQLGHIFPIPSQPVFALFLMVRA
jgi:hypothetical protein